jgi:hypothetical protein
MTNAAGLNTGDQFGGIVYCGLCANKILRPEVEQITITWPGIPQGLRVHEKCAQRKGYAS